VTDDTGAVVRSYTYRAFGLESAEGEAVDARTFAQGEELGDVIRLGVRLYDPEVGRFLSPDPIYQVLNQYSYAEGNPVELWDPDGRAACGGLCIAFAGVVVMAIGVGYEIYKDVRDQKQKGGCDAAPAGPVGASGSLIYPLFAVGRRRRSDNAAPWGSSGGLTASAA